MPWAVNDQGCCCEDGCEIYVPCCVNGILATWQVKNDLTNPSADGITLEAHIENLCNGDIGLDWSRWLVGGTTSRKMYATVDAPNAVEIIQSIEKFGGAKNDYLNAGCLMGLNIQPGHVVCPCDEETDGNFKLVVKVFNCEDQDATWFMNLGSRMQFSLGLMPLSNDQGETGEAFNCEVPRIGYTINGSAVQPITPETSGDDIPFVVPQEGSVTLEWYFSYNPECVICVDPGTFEDTPPKVIEATPTTDFNEGTPKKDCRENTCNNSVVGEIPAPLCFRDEPEECHYEDCVDCKSAPTSPTHTVDGEIVPFDPRAVACWNCYWFLVHQAGWEVPTTDPKDIYNAGVGADTECKCGCPTCSSRRETINCVSRNIVGPGSSASGTERVCWQGPGGVTYWHGSIGDGCVESFQYMTRIRYFGPAGSVSMTLENQLFPLPTDGGLDAQGVIDIDNFIASLDPCDIYDIAWETTDGPGPGEKTISMTIGTVTASRTITPGFVRAAETIVWIRDHDCA